MQKTLPFLLLSLIAACGGGGGPARTHAIFDTETGNIPLPNDLAQYALGGGDGSLNIDPLDPLDPADPFGALSALDGWSTVAPFTIDFDGKLKSASLVAGSAIRIFEMQTSQTFGDHGWPVTNVVRELGDDEFSVELAAEDASESTVRVKPTVPFEESTTYMVVVTSSLKDKNGKGVARDTDYENGANGTDLGLSLFIGPMLDAALSRGISGPDVALSYSFTTQSISPVLNAVSMVADGGEQSIIDDLVAAGVVDTSAGTVADTQAASTGMVVAKGDSTAWGGSGEASVWSSSLSAPYYLDAASNPSSTLVTTDDMPLVSHWDARFSKENENNLTRWNYLPVSNGNEQMPVLITTPADMVTYPPPWAVVIFQHGITADRESLMGIADKFAQNGMAAVAIDLPLHGLPSTNVPLFAGFQNGTVRERTFGMDFLDNTTGDAVSDGIADTSGAHFMNLASFLTSRDNVRQAISDLCHLHSVLSDFDIDSASFDTTQVYYMGHSLGGIVGTGFLRIEEDIDAAVLAMPGGGIPKMLEASVSFGPDIEAGLGSVGILPGTSDWEDFMWLAQTVTDSGDPINHAVALGANATPVYLIEVVGDGGANLPDQVVPNNSADAPLSGTDPLIASLGLDIISTTTSSSKVAVQFTEGDHSSIINAAGSAAALAEMQNQAIGFFLSGGMTLTVIDNSVVK